MADDTGSAAGPSYFSVLGLPELYGVDPEALESAFHRMSRLLHPDRYARATPLERRMAVQRTTLVNDAYRTLKDPVRRAEYLLKKRGLYRGEEAGTTDAELLMEIMEGRERAAELKEMIKTGAAEAIASLRAERAASAERIGAVGVRLEEAFARFDAGEEGPALDEIGSAFERMRYYQGIAEELARLALQAGETA